jgi:FkbM family methyltransferase
MAMARFLNGGTLQRELDHPLPGSVSCLMALWSISCTPQAAPDPEDETHAMKLRELVYLLGFRPRPQRYGSQIVRFDLDRDGPVDYAQWLHPREKPKTLSQDVVDELRNYISPGDVAIDVGAHTGDTSVPMAVAAGPDGCVIALEPNPYVFSVLEQNAALNKDKGRILPLMFAATPVAGQFEFEYADAGFCNGGLHAGISKWRHGHAFKLPVEGRNLVTYLTENHPDLLPRVRFVKVDAEGYDYDVLCSLEPLLRAQHPYVKAEVFKLLTLAQREKLYDFLVDLGYEVYRVVSERQHRGPRLERTGLMSPPHYDLFAVPESRFRAP